MVTKFQLISNVLTMKKYAKIGIVSGVGLGIIYYYLTMSMLPTHFDAAVQLAPHYVGALTLYLENEIKQEFIDKYNGEFIKINDDESLEELYGLIDQINTKEEIVFRVNHGSNAYTVKGTFPEDKQEMLDKVEWMKEHPEIVRPQGIRGF